jgi:UDP-N-acetylmuramate--alanine ligase
MHVIELHLPPLDAANPARVHVVGAGGAGMSAIAIVLSEMGYRVSGSDRVAGAALDRLRAEGVTTFVGHEPGQVDGVDLLTVSTAVGSDNPEIAAAEAAGIPVWSRGEMLAAISRQKPAVAVAGTHGKTTTSSMLTMALTEAGLDPGFVIGAPVEGLGTNARWSADATWLVVEADESDGTFLGLVRRAGVVTSIEPDHLGHYGSTAALEESFVRFVEETDGPVAVCLDDLGVRRLVAAAPNAVTYGVAVEAEVRIVDHRSQRRSSVQTLRHAGIDRELTLAVPGLHNARNAAAAYAVAVSIGVEPEQAINGLARYAGVARRFEYRGEVDGVTFVDDYAHLPTEIEATLTAAADGGWGRVVAIFQPHRYTRTADLHASFARAFDRCDLLVVTDIYPSGEPPLPGVTGRLVADAALDAHPWRRLAYLPGRADLVSFLTSELRAGDLCLTMGAGDLTTLPDELLRLMGSRAA